MFPASSARSSPALALARPRSPSLSLPDALVQTCLVQDRPRPAAGVSSADAGLGHALSQAPRKRPSQEQTWALDLEPIEPRLVKGVDFCERWVLLYGTVNRHTDSRVGLVALTRMRLLRAGYSMAWSFGPARGSLSLSADAVSLRWKALWVYSAARCPS